MRVVFFIVALAINANAWSKDFGGVSVSKVNRVYDGDTFFVNIDQLHPIVGSNIGIRISGIDTPEIKRWKCDNERIAAVKAKSLLNSILENAKAIELKRIRRGKFFRIVADVYVDNSDVSKSMIDSGYAVPYHGGKKHSWCKVN